MWRSSSVPITQKDLSSSRSAGWSNERSHGSGDAGVSPKIGRISTERRSHFCASLQSGSCSENYAILHDLSGQTLSVQRDGAELLLDTCLQIVLLNLCTIYKAQLGNIDLSFLDKVVLAGKAS